MALHVSSFAWAGVNGQEVAAPAVPRVFAIYGVNCPTEVGAAYRYRNCYRMVNRVNTGLVLDAEASLKQGSGYTIQKGILMETKDTKQVGEVRVFLFLFFIFIFF